MDKIIIKTDNIESKSYLANYLTLLFPECTVEVKLEQSGTPEEEYPLVANSGSKITDNIQSNYLS